MRTLVIALIAGLAAFMGWLWFQPECAGGSVVATEQECLGIPGFDRRFCATAFARPDEVVMRAGNVFQTQSDCQMRHPVCIEYPGIHGWTPKPTGFCVVRGDNGALASMRPVYGPRK